MKKRENIPFFLLIFLACTIWSNGLYAQGCPWGIPPVYDRSCFTEYFTSITATGTGGFSSTVSVSASACTGTYHFDPTQVITARVGDTVTLHITRATDHYTAYMTVYADWNLTGYDPPTELLGSALQLSPITTTANYTFVVPYCGNTVGSRPLRVMLSESPNATPCAANWGETYDFYINVQCPVIPPSSFADTICVGDTVTMRFPPCGNWTSGNPAIATIGASTGLVTGVMGGVSMLTYTRVGCTPHIAYIWVNPEPIVPIRPQICYHSPSMIISGTPGGVWTATPAAAVTIYPTIYPSSYGSTGSAVGVIGLTPGTVTISYTALGCTITKLMTIADPLTFSVPPLVCQDRDVAFTALGSYVSGDWSSLDVSVATATTSSWGDGIGTIHGVSLGSTSVVFASFAFGCRDTIPITVLPSPTISGSSHICVSTTTTLSVTTPGGTWSSSNPAKATVSAAGVVTAGSTPGSSTITYTAPNGCIDTRLINVGGYPVITGPTNVCETSSIALTASVPIGTGAVTWTSSDISKATVNAVGVVTGISVGSITITVTTIHGCTDTHIMTVNPSPVISGVSTLVCGNYVSLTSTLPGGTWTSSNTAIATTPPGAPGDVIAAGIGVATISYTTTLGCVDTHPITVTGFSISGPATICTGSFTSYSAGATLGTWSSSNPAVAVVYPTGMVHGLSSGTTIISYESGTCFATRIVEVEPQIFVSGCSALCAGANCNITPSPSITAYGSSNSSVATLTDLGSGSFQVNGISAGTATITLGTGLCAAYYPMTVHPIPYVSGPVNVCPGAPITLSASPSGGSWTSDNTSIITVSSGGVVSYAGPGWTYIDYISPAGCARNDYAVASGAGITGPEVLCVGSSAGTYTGSPSGGTWSASPSSIGSITSSGVFTHSGALGSATITYTAPGCSPATRIINVYDAHITGPSKPCTADDVNYSAPSSGGTWVSTNFWVISLNSVGHMLSASSGTSTISYTIGSCYDTKSVQLFTSPNPDLWHECTGGAECDRGFIWTNHISVSPTGGAWTSSTLNFSVDADAGGHANATVGPVSISPFTTYHGSATYTISYPADGVSCPITWRFEYP